MTALEALQRAALFRDFTETGLKIFAAIAVERSLAAGAPLFVQDAPGESLFVVKSGTLRITHRTSEGEKELGVVEAGEHVGELALLARSVRLVSAVAATPCEVLELARRDFVQLHAQKPQACLKLAIAIAQDLARWAGESRAALQGVARRPPAA